MLDFIQNNKNHLEKSNLFFKDNSLKKQLSEYINSDSLVIISGLKSTRQTSVVADLLKSSNYKKNYLYINKALDYKNIINKEKDFFDIYDTYIENFSKPKIIIFENIGKVNGFKDFLNHIYKLNHKIIIIGNDIEIRNKPEIKINGVSIKQMKMQDLYDYTITDLLKYGSDEDILLLEKESLKERFLELNKNNIIYDLTKSFSIKNTYLYQYTITYLSIYNGFISLRELHKDINKSIKLALLSSMEYIEYSLKSSIIEKIYNYDIKNNKTLVQKAKYFFTDLGFRNSLNIYKTDTYTLKENLVYNELKKAGYNIEGGVFGAFEFSFIARKENEISYIHISKEKQKNEIIKEMRKIQKAYHYNSINIEKVYILVENLEGLGFKKTKKDDVELVDFEEFIKKSL